MKLIKLLSTLTLVMFMAGCQEESKSPDLNTRGVSQGNGMATYSSLVYKYQIQYKSSLRFEEKSNKEILIDNMPLLKTGEAISSLTLKALEPSETNNLNFKTPEELYNYLVTKFPHRNWQKVEYRGATAYFAEAQVNTTTESEYYIYSPSIIYGKMIISENSTGSDHIKSIIQTFTVDTTAPVISEIKLEIDTLEAGQTGKILFKATDDVSGLNLSGTWTQGHFNPKDSTSWEDNKISAYGPDIISLGNGWYSLEFTINKFAKPGVYKLSSFYTTDLAGNRVHLNLFPQQANYRAVDNYNKYSETNIPAVFLNVTNSSASDTTAPVISEIKLEIDTLEAGQSGKILFKATDDISGLNLSGTWTQGYFNPKDSTSWEDSRISAYGPSVISMGNGWYSLEFTINKFAKAGTYKLSSFGVTDLAGNKVYLNLFPKQVNYRAVDNYNKHSETNIPAVFLNVTNSISVDTTSPVISEIKLENNTLEAGQSGKILFKATDDVSGLNLTGTWTQGYFHPQESNGWDDNRISAYGPGIISLGNGWYSLEFTINKFAKPGVYKLSSFYTTDLAGNKTHITLYPKDSYYRLVSDKTVFTQIPALYLTVK